MSARLCGASIVADNKMFTEASFTKRALSFPPHCRLVTLRVGEDFGVKRVRITALIAVGLVLCASPAGAGLIPTTGSFFTAPADADFNDLVFALQFTPTNVERTIRQLDA
jgi:hypothetical protein